MVNWSTNTHTHTMTKLCDHSGGQEEKEGPVLYLALSQIGGRSKFVINFKTFSAIEVATGGEVLL